MNGTLSIILGVAILILFFIFELDLVHTKKNLSFHKELFPLNKQKYISLTEKEQRYLYKIIERRYELKNLLSIFKELSSFGLNNLSNDERALLDDNEIRANLFVINKIQGSIGCRLIGTSFTVGIKIILGVFFIFVIPIIISFFI